MLKLRTNRFSGVADDRVDDVVLRPERRVVGDDGEHDDAEGHHDEDQVEAHQHLERNSRVNCNSW